LIVSEFNATFNAHDPALASPFMAAWLADTVRRCDGLAFMLAWWTFTDVFEEEGVPQRPMDGGFGIIGIDGIPKPSFAAFALLHRLGDRAFATGSSHLIATRRSDGALVLAAYNMVPPGTAGAPLRLKLRLRRGRKATIRRVDETHANAMPLYHKMGDPVYPSPDQVRALDAATDPGPAKTVSFRHGVLDLVVPVNGLALIEIPR
jgi:xylan 1,4-beta-xylosidase